MDRNDAEFNIFKESALQMFMLYVETNRKKQIEAFQLTHDSQNWINPLFTLLLTQITFLC